MFKNLMLAAVVVLAGFGCQSTVNTVENAEVPVPANVVKDKRVITDKFLRDRLEVRLVQETRTDAGNLRVQVTAVNARTGFFSQLWSGLTGENPYRIDYKFVWLDEQGIARIDPLEKRTGQAIDRTGELQRFADRMHRAAARHSLDDDERAALLSANLMSEFERTKVIPEVDAVRFATLADSAGSTVAANLTTSDVAYKAVMAGEQAVEDLGVDLSTCILYCTSAVKGLLRENQKQNYRLAQGEDPNGRFAIWDEMKVVTVPSARFQSKVDLLDGTTDDQEAGGFAAAADAVALNFMIVHPSACAAIQKHKKLRYFAPDVNQGKDAHLWQYRLFHDLLVYENRKGLIYCHTAAGAGA